MRAAGASMLAAALASCAMLVSRAHAACECGYQDPSTGDIWTDATITYFNETGLSDVVTDVQQSPAIYGEQTAGSTGDGQKSWSLIGDHINKWENSFGATYLSAVSFNNTYSTYQSRGLSMQVSPADEKRHIVNGSQVVTRRRDIQYGSFRAFILPAASYNMNGGSAFTFGVSYNESETVGTTILTSNFGYDNHTLQWSYAASDDNASPVMNNLTLVEPGSDVQAGLEHRMDWSNTTITFANSGTNSTANNVTYVKKINATNIPSMAAPVSFQTWSNGEPSVSMGPPLYHSAVTNILYTRFFYNSTLDARNTQFQQQCQSTLAPVCSTEDLTLRNSTAFDVASLAQIQPQKLSFTVPLYAIIIESIAVGLFVLMVIHVLAAKITKSVIQRKASVPTDDDQRLRERQSNSKLTSQGSSKEDLSSNERKEGFNSSTDVVQKVLMTRQSSYAGSRHGSSVGHGQALQYRRNSNTPMSRSSSFNHGMHPSRPRDITDLDFGAWDTDSEYDSDDNMHADRISGNFEQYGNDNWEDDKAFNEEILPSHLVKEGTSSSGSASPVKENTESPQPAQIVRWEVREERPGTAMGAQLAQPRSGSDAEAIVRDNGKGQLLQLPALLGLFFERLDKIFFVSQSNVFTSAGARRIDYLDGMRGMACLFVSFNHFILIFFHGISDPASPHHYTIFEHVWRYAFAFITNNSTLLLGTFFALPARVLCLRYLTKGGLGDFADKSIRRIPRMMLPVTTAALFNYFLIDVNGFKWVQRLASRTWSTWSYWQGYDNALVFFNSVVTLCWGGPPASPALVTHYATGVLWTIPVMVQGTWTSMLATLIAREIKNPIKRFSFYFVCVIFSWYAKTWDMFFLTGLIVGDLDNKLNYRQLAVKGIPLPFPSFRNKDKWARLHGKWLAWGFFLACVAEQLIAHIDPAPGSNMNNIEQSFHPDWKTSLPLAYEGNNGYQGYTSPIVFGFLFILALFMLVDLSPAVQKFFRFRAWQWLGVHAMSIYLLHGIIWWTWGAWLCITMLTHGAPYWAAVLTVLITGYAILFLIAICFTHTFEAWATTLAKALWRAASGNMGRKV